MRMLSEFLMKTGNSFFEVKKLQYISENKCASAHPIINIFLYTLANLLMHFNNLPLIYDGKDELRTYKRFVPKILRPYEVLIEKSKTIEIPLFKVVDRIDEINGLIGELK